jgi:pyruvate dehydrogenase E1 component alpha subunit
VDGTDVEAMAEAFQEAVEVARDGDGPALLEASCHRFRGHYEGDPDHYRSKVARDEMVAKGDPIAIAGARLLETGGIGTIELDGIEGAAREEMASLLAQVRSEPEPDVSGVLADVFAGTAS